MTGVLRAPQFLVMAGVLSFAQVPCAAPPEAPAAGSDVLLRLEQELARIARTVSGDVGVAALHLERDMLATYRADVRFPMASVYKIPIAVQLLTRAGRGEIDLDSLVALGPDDLRPGSGVLAHLFVVPGVRLSIRNLLRPSLMVSDNTATDILLRLAGGPERVTARLRQLGIKEMRVDRSTLQLILASDGIEGAVPDDAYTEEAYDRVLLGVQDRERTTAAWRAFTDVRDTATPRAMVELLRLIWTGEAVSGEGRDILLDAMLGSGNERRIGGLLPPGTASPTHKTGTIWGGGLYTVNDVGLIELPGGAGHVALALFIGRARGEVEDLEETIAHLARTVVDGFLLTGP
jgi:beta-lactamase class A